MLNALFLPLFVRCELSISWVFFLNSQKFIDWLCALSSLSFFILPPSLSLALITSANPFIIVLWLLIVNGGDIQSYSFSLNGCDFSLSLLLHLHIALKLYQNVVGVSERMNTLPFGRDIEVQARATQITEHVSDAMDLPKYKIKFTTEREREWERNLSLTWCRSRSLSLSSYENLQFS